MRVENKVATVTGGDSGTGRATAELLAEEVVKVVVVDIDLKGGTEIVGTILFLASEEAGYTMGSHLRVDGGYSAQ